MSSEAAAHRLAEAEDALLRRDVVVALQAFAEAAAAGADADRCDGGRWLAHMLLGEFEQAWQAGDATRSRGAPDPHRYWQGGSLEGRRVMLRSLHGYGDAVQMLRYAPGLREVAASVTLEVAPRFVELAQRFAGVDEVITWGEGAPEVQPAWDVQMEVMELPYIFRTRVDDLPIARNYLKAPRLEVDRRGDALQVGVAWTAGAWNVSRSLHWTMLEPILEVPGCCFWSLEGGESVDLRAMKHAGVREDPLCRSTLLGMAERIAQLDLVITVDSLAAHLAGASGVPVWVLLQHRADWRWMLERSDSPWYPTMRLFRQPVQGDWSSVVTEVVRALEQKAGARHQEVRA